MQDFRVMLSQARPKITIPFSIGHLNPIPHRYRLGRWRHKIRGRYDPDDVTAIKTSFNPLETIARVRSHRWSWYDLQYLFLFTVAVFSLAIAPMHVAFKIAFSALLTVLLLLPITSQFFWPGVAIWTYLIYYFGSRFIPVEARPHIWVKVLPALENILYGANLSNILSAHTNAVLDVLAWLPYGILHFSLPFFVTVILFVFASPGTAPVWARAFGWMNMMGVTIQLVFPCTPPWYETVHGLDVPAYYGMEGSPAGLARIDKLFGFDMYTTNFTKGPLPFGAFPSLHAGNATLEALFLSYCFPRFRPLFFAYVAWVWWATMYLSHHYAVDLVGGSLLAAACFYYSRAWWLPRRQEGKSNRWDYEWIERGEHHASTDEEYGLPAYDKLGNRRYSAESDEWTLGSSSGFSSSGASASGSMSPVLNDWESDLSRDELHEAIVR